jgi:hypothetical protein
MHPRHIPLLQPVNRPRQLLAQALVLDLADGIRIRMEGEDNRLAFGQAMDRLPFAAEDSLPD